MTPKIRALMDAHFEEMRPFALALEALAAKGIDPAQGAKFMQERMAQPLEGCASACAAEGFLSPAPEYPETPAPEPGREDDHQ